MKDSLFEKFKNKELNVDKFTAIVEISKGSKNKYEYDRETGLLKLDRILYTSTHYPHNYGFIPLTLDDDGDPLDVLIISSEPIVPLSTVECKAIGVLEMIDGGLIDYKLMAVCLNDPFYNNFNYISELPNHISDEIQHFFQVYKLLENKSTKIGNMIGKEFASEVIKKCVEQYKKS